MTGRLRGLRRRVLGMRMLGGIAAQASQAIASLALSVLAARHLGLAGLGTYATLNALITVATAVSSGFVGDSYTVLDRSQPTLRAGMQVGLAAIAAVTFVVFGVGGVVFSGFDIALTLAFAGAGVAYLVEDHVRRMLMASIRFWRIVVVDLVAMFVALVPLVARLVTDRPISLTGLMAALGLGQVVAAVVGWLLVPRRDRWMARLRPAAVGEVARYGTWRALLQASRAAMLAGMRFVCAIVISTSAVGALEAARLYMAPAVLAVTGAGSYLFASYASGAHHPLSSLLSFADRSVIKLLVAVGLFGAVSIAALPVLEDVLTSGDYRLSYLAVAGWAAFAAASAAVTPYGQLAAVRHRQKAVFWIRTADGVVSLALIWMVLSLTHSANWVPLILAAVSLLDGWVIRRWILLPLVAVESAEERRQTVVV